MSTSNKDTPVQVQPTALMAIEFTLDYTPSAVQGEGLEPNSLGVVLSTIERLTESCSSTIGLGQLTAFYSFRGGRSFALNKAANSIHFEYYKDTSRWSEMGQAFPNYIEQDFPMLPTREEIIRLLTEESDVSYFGFKYQSNNDWEHHLKSSSHEAQKFQPAGMVTMQIDVLLKSSQHPHGRLCLQYEAGSLWVWATQQDDYCIIFAGPNISAEALGCIIHCGESFILN